MIVVERLFDILPYHAEKYNPKPDVLAYKESGKWITYSIKEYKQAADTLSYALIASGISKGDKIATIMPGRPEWNIIDIAILQAGAVHVPIYPTIKEADYRYILRHGEVKFLFIPGMEIFRKVEHIIPEMEGLLGVCSLKEIDGLIAFNSLMEKGKEAIKAEIGDSDVRKQPDILGEPETSLDEIRKSIRTHDLATIIYTSGTTGNPKGVMLTHANIIINHFPC
ncbi:MAG TPA: AMP-binding protein [Bacteroidales bacterium]|nr:AMP-binding protein [Bacteroidales bacterium]